MLKITKAEAIKLMHLDLGKQTSENVNHYFSSEPGCAALTFNGCKLYSKVRGCVVSYFISGYSYNKQDEREACYLAGIFRPWSLESVCGNFNRY